MGLSPREIPRIKVEKMLKDAGTPLKVFMLTLFLGLIAFFCWRLYVTYKIEQNGTFKMATIEGYRQKLYNPQSINSKTLTYAPEFSFIANDNKKYTLLSNYDKQKKYDVGEKVKVFYLDNNPKTAILEGYFPYKTYIILAIIMLIGFSMLLYTMIKKS